MSLPKEFQNPKDYFEECVSFFREYQNLYNFANIDILVNKTFDSINLDLHNLENINVFDKKFDLPSLSENNNYIKEFLRKLERLQVIYEIVTEIEEIQEISVPLSPKKKHEIVYLANEIIEIAEENDCDTVVDLGSGLGYLDQFLFEKRNFKVLGFECNENNFVNAKKRQRKYHMNSIKDVKYIRHRITEHSTKNVAEYLADKFPKHGNFCITGLHACADLTVDAVNLFLKMEFAKAMIIMPCCYHKMAQLDGRFKNFPLSGTLKEIFYNNTCNDFMKIPFLRLASQPSQHDDCLKNLVFNLMSRATLQLYAHIHNFKLQRKKRKAVKIKMLSNDFETYIRSATENGFTIKNENSITENKDEITNFDLEELKLLWQEISKITFKKAAIFILLQNYLQPVIENFVLFDRLLYLKENGIDNCRFKKIVNEKISPRCLALFSLKI